MISRLTLVVDIAPFSGLRLLRAITDDLCVLRREGS